VIAGDGVSERHLRVAKVCKSYGRQRALVDVSVTFASGQVSAIVGPNGAGKTTLLGILSTLTRPTSGEIFLADEPITQNPAARQTIGYVGHEPGVYPDLSARQNLRIFASLYALADAETRITSMLERVDLADVRGDLPARSYSRGMLQRLALARALLHEPEREAGRLVILVTHDLDAAAQVAGHLIVIRRGRVALDHVEASGFTAAQVRGLYEEALRAG
jgi:heme exporter protein A